MHRSLVNINTPMRYNEIAPKKLSKKDAKEAAKQAEFKVRFDKEQAEREVSKKKIDAFKNAISPYMGKQEVEPSVFWHYMNTPKGKATFTIKDVYYTTEPRMELFWLLAADRGAGRAAMEIMCDLADKYGVILELDAIPLRGMQNDLKLKQSQLNRFYQSFDFKIEKRKKDKYPYMVRHPKGETISEGMSIRTFYHGSNHHITAFSLDHLGQGQGADQEGPGIYLTSSKEDAAKYGKIIHTVAVSIPKSRLLKKKRALRAGVESLIRRAPDRDEVLQNWDENPQIGFYKAVGSIMDAYGDDCREAYEAVWGDFYRDHSADYLRRLIRFGYDGFELPRQDGIVHLIAFNPAKLKIVSAEEMIREGFSPPTKWKWTQRNEMEYVAVFKIGKITYTASLFRSHSDTWDFSFTAASKTEDYGFDASGTGNAWTVFGTIVDIARQFIKIRNPSEIKIESDITERNRSAVNNRIAKAISDGLGYSVRSVDDHTTVIARNTK